MNFMIGIAACALGLSLGAWFGHAAQAETLDQLYAKAKTEGALHIYGGGPARLYEGWAKEFEQKFPGIKVTITGGFAGELAPKIDKEIADKKVVVDFVTFQA